MISVARAKGRGAKCHVRFSIADALALDEPDKYFDAARSERTLQWLSHPEAAVAEMGRPHNSSSSGVRAPPSPGPNADNGCSTEGPTPPYRKCRPRSMLQVSGRLAGWPPSTDSARVSALP
jgi:Methyltransferase domain